MWADQKAGETSGETEAAVRSELLNEARKSVMHSILDTPLLQVEATCVASDHTIHLFGLFPNSSLVLWLFSPLLLVRCLYRSCDVPGRLSSSSPVSDCLHTFSPVSDCFSSPSRPLQVLNFVSEFRLPSVCVWIFNLNLSSNSNNLEMHSS